MSIARVKGRSGFTIAEVLIASGVFIFVSGAMISLFIYASNLWQLVIVQEQLRSGACTAMLFMTNELQDATRSSNQNPSPNLAIPASPNNNSITFFLPDTTVPDRIQETGNPATNGSTAWNTNHAIRYVYDPVSQQLRRMVAGNAAYKILCYNVNAVAFEDCGINPALNPDEVRVTLTVGKNTLTGIRAITLVSLIKLRN